MNKLAYAFAIFAFCFQAIAQEGKILQVLSGDSAYIMREGTKHKVEVDFELKQNDEIFSEDSVILFHLYPSTQICLSKNSQIKLDESFISDQAGTQKSVSVLSFIKGLIRLNVSKDTNEELEQKVQADGVSFAVRGTDYEISLEGDHYDLDVHEGAVEVASPHVMTFVPEIVKAGKGFRFNRKQKKFLTRKFKPKFKNHPSFLKAAELHERWSKAKEVRKMRREKWQAKKKARKNKNKRNRK